MDGHFFLFLVDKSGKIKSDLRCDKFKRNRDGLVPISVSFCGRVAEWLTQRSAKPRTRVRFPSRPQKFTEIEAKSNARVLF